MWVVLNMHFHCFWHAKICPFWSAEMCLSDFYITQLFITFTTRKLWLEIEPPKRPSQLQFPSSCVVDSDHLQLTYTCVVCKYTRIFCLHVYMYMVLILYVWTEPKAACLMLYPHLFISRNQIFIWLVIFWQPRSCPHGLVEWETPLTCQCDGCLRSITKGTTAFVCMTCLTAIMCPECGTRGVPQVATQCYAGLLQAFILF